MRRRNLVFSALSAGLSSPAAWAGQQRQEKADWSPFFTQADAQSSIVVLDARGTHETTSVHNMERAEKRYSPASTFKIAHSLFALDAGLLRDEFQVIAWDGVKRPVAAWNQDQTLRSAVRNSAVWGMSRSPKNWAMHAKPLTCNRPAMAMPWSRATSRSG